MAQTALAKFLIGMTDMKERIVRWFHRKITGKAVLVWWQNAMRGLHIFNERRVTGNGETITVNYSKLNGVVSDIDIKPTDFAILSFRVHFPDDFEFVLGGKLLGLGPDDASQLWSKPATPDTWSARIMWRKNGQAALYLYHQDRRGQFGDYINSNVYFEAGRSYDIELFVQVNNPYDVRNGYVELDIDGETCASAWGVQFRGARGRHTLITKLLFHTFFGGNTPEWEPSKELSATFSRVRVALR